MNPVNYHTAINKEIVRYQSGIKTTNACLFVIPCDVKAS